MIKIQCSIKNRLSYPLAAILALTANIQSCGADSAIFKTLDNKTPTGSEPVALISGPLEARVKTSVTLDAMQSRDPAGKPLTYQWDLPQRPNASRAALSSATAPSVTFTPDKGGHYAVSLKVTNSANAVSSIVLQKINVTGTGRNHPPVAIFTFTSSIGSAILDASDSYDLDGESLLYKWSFAAMASGAADPLTGEMALAEMFIDKRTSKIACFYSTVPGNYAVQLDVSDGLDSDTAINSVQVSQ
ncbi:MAG: PKD domain-containing protein [Nitrospinae bacterium]|nr:PKD domain-containing protein [Nitrospinota bacterium]